MPEELTLDPTDFKLHLFLESVQPFSQLNRQEIGALARLCTHKRYQPQDYIFTEQDKGQTLFIVKEGELILEILWQQSKIFSPGAIFGEIALIDENTRTGRVKALTESTLICISGDDILDENKFSTKAAFKIFKELARKVTSYLRSREQTTTQELIKKGESKNIEFKPILKCSSSREVDRRAKSEIIRTIAGFLNSDGGTLMIGIGDKKEILGLREPSDEDATKRCLTDVVKNRIGKQYASFINCDVEVIEDKRVLRVDCKPALSPVYIKDFDDDGREKLFVRTGPETEELRTSEIYDYIQYRFARSLA